MPAEYEDGFSVREPMWHGLGTILPDYMEREEAFQYSGQNWTVERLPIALEVSDLWTPRHIDGYFAATRSDNHKVLAVLKDSYQELQNTEGWDLAEAFADQDKAIRWETAASLQDGRTCFVLLADDDFVIGGDSSRTRSYILVSWGHDGSTAMTARKTTVRVVCRNTLDMALSKNAATYTFKHTRNVKDRIEDAKAALTGMRQDTVLYRNLMESLQKTRVFRPGITKVLDDFIGDATWGAEGSDKTRAKAIAESKGRAKLMQILNGPTVDGNETRGYTGYDVLNAGVEYLDWSRKARSQETRFARTFLDPGTEKQELLNLVQEVAV